MSRPYKPYDDGDNVLVRFDGIQAETDAAVRVTGDDYGWAEWIPRSQIAYLDEEAGEMWCSLWIAEKKGLPYE